MTLGINKRKRSKREGLLTENERAYLQGNNASLDARARANFLNSLSARIKQVTFDLQLLAEKANPSNTSKDENKEPDSFIAGFVAAHYGEVLQIHTSIRRFVLPQPTALFLGRVKWWGKTLDGTMRRVYWLDNDDRFRMQWDKVSHPDHLLRGLKPPKVRDVIRKAFQTDSEYLEKAATNTALVAINGGKFMNPILPRSEPFAITIEEIRALTWEKTKMMKGLP